jgi:hypothetical protein
MQKNPCHKLPALALVMLFMLAISGYGQPAVSSASAAIEVTATVAAPLGVSLQPASESEALSTAADLLVLCPTRADVLLTLTVGGQTVASHESIDSHRPTDWQLTGATTRVIDCSHLIESIPCCDTALLTVIITEN